MRPEQTVPLGVVFACTVLGCSPRSYLGSLNWRIALTALINVGKPPWVWVAPSGSSPDKRAMAEGRPIAFCSLGLVPSCHGSWLTFCWWWQFLCWSQSQCFQASTMDSGSAALKNLVGFRHHIGAMAAPSPWTEPLLVPSLTSVRQLLLLF